MPAYNEEQTIGAAIDEVVARVLSHIPAGEIIVVDDGSSDSTGLITLEKAAYDTRVKHLRRSNGGHGPAVISGLAAACGDNALLLDSDCQIDLIDFVEQMTKINRGRAFYATPERLGEYILVDYVGNKRKQVK